MKLEDLPPAMRAAAERQLAPRPAPVPLAEEIPDKHDLRAEKALQNEFEQWLRLSGYMYRREPMHKATMAPTGHPDFTLYLDRGITAFVEYKTETGVVSPEQEAYHTQLRALGHCVYVCRSLPEAIRCLRDSEKHL